tara:strand:+ start:882 stop:1154 length:273 start_codon:yes stop_codon:yes gene_type:complete
MTAEPDDQENEDAEDLEDTSGSAAGTETISEAALDDLAGDDADADVDPDALVDEKETDNDLADIRRRIEKLEEEKRFQTDLEYLDEDIDD